MIWLFTFLAIILYHVLRLRDGLEDVQRMLRGKEKPQP